METSPFLLWRVQNFVEIPGCKRQRGRGSANSRNRRRRWDEQSPLGDTNGFLLIANSGIGHKTQWTKIARIGAQWDSLWVKPNWLIVTATTGDLSTPAGMSVMLFRDYNVPEGSATSVLKWLTPEVCSPIKRRIEGRYHHWSRIV